MNIFQFDDASYNKTAEGTYSVHLNRNYVVVATVTFNDEYLAMEYRDFKNGKKGLHTPINEVGKEWAPNIKVDDRVPNGKVMLLANGEVDKVWEGLEEPSEPKAPGVIFTNVAIPPVEPPKPEPTPVQPKVATETVVKEVEAPVKEKPVTPVKPTDEEILTTTKVEPVLSPLTTDSEAEFVVTESPASPPVIEKPKPVKSTPVAKPKVDTKPTTEPTT